MAQPSDTAPAAGSKTGGADLSLDEMRRALAPLVADAAAFDGWGDAAVDHAAQQAGIDPAAARYAFRGGPMAMITAWIDTVDAEMAQALPAEVLAVMPIRERIRALVMVRLELVGSRQEALRRALAIQALPRNLGQTLQAGWRSADLMWRLAGDRATDYNHYTKRITLGSILAATIAVFVDDDSDGKSATRAFLDRRIEGVMRFEKAKARLLAEREGFSVTRFLGRLRYPAT
jgi:ubiquinone biosynthesis protein COQ9